MDTNLIERFESKIFYSPDGCHYWIASTNNAGYGLIAISTGITKSAHRIAYELYKGPIHSGLLVCHTCDNPLCVNPDHLWLGTNSDNMKDCVNKGRWGAFSGKRGNRVCDGKYNNVPIGSIIGISTVMSFSHIKGTDVYWNVRCRCGKDRKVKPYKLYKGQANSCGCLRPGRTPKLKPDTERL